MGAIECTNGVCNVAFVCEDGICVVSKNGPNTPTEEKYVREGFSGKTNPERVTPYPVIRMSEILESPDDATAVIEETTKRLRNISYQNCLADFNRTGDALEVLLSNYRSFVKNQSNVARDIFKSIEQLDKYYQEFSTIKNMNEENQIKFDLVKKNLKHRHEMVAEFLYLCSMINSARENIVELSEKFRKASSELQKESLNANKVFE